MVLLYQFILLDFDIKTHIYFPFHILIHVCPLVPQAIIKDNYKFFFQIPILQKKINLSFNHNVHFYLRFIYLLLPSYHHRSFFGYHPRKFFSFLMFLRFLSLTLLLLVLSFSRLLFYFCFSVFIHFFLRVSSLLYPPLYNFFFSGNISSIIFYFIYWFKHFSYNFLRIFAPFFGAKVPFFMHFLSLNLRLFVMS